MSDAYQRPTLAWIKRRARRLQRAYGVARRLAIFDAWCDYINFTGIQPDHLVFIGGGKK
jgi:hypothetical protein